ncbi:hypothetical protein EHN07_19480 [Buttiauxella warmboldiae]|uniref:DUF1311 domain-containing protein n=1 Tax=Buttiauxella warmboldiae TaxID=82993 RepID=A0A3N5D0X8_9ENTR|nr:hypothetical protein [Buttiauxella warmboldiae]RPH20760.1 hypothetical protein EHN07_19480 [Buttiauxella warmboldiae]
MKLYKALFIPALLLSGIFNSNAGAADTNLARQYITHWNAVMNGEMAPILRATTLNADIVKRCKTVAAKRFRSAMVSEWQHKTGSKMTENAFLSEDLQQFDRLAAISCLDGAEYEQTGSGDLLIKALSAQWQEIAVKEANDAYEQTKIMQFQTGILTARYGISIEKNRLHNVN